MVGRENQLAPLIRALFVIRLVTVGFPSCGISPISSSHWQSFEGRVCYHRIISAILTLGTVMACMMFLWDYLLTFGMEVNHVWKSKWNFTKGLYLFQRYLPFTEFIWLVLSCQFDMDSNFLDA